MEAVHRQKCQKAFSASTTMPLTIAVDRVTDASFLNDMKRNFIHFFYCCLPVILSLFRSGRYQATVAGDCCAMAMTEAAYFD